MITYPSPTQIKTVAQIRREQQLQSLLRALPISSQTQLDQKLKLFAPTQKHSPRQPCPHMSLYTQQLSPDPKPETSTCHYDQAGGTDSVHDLQRHLIPRNDIKSPGICITILLISIASTTHYPTIPVCLCLAPYCNGGKSHQSSLLSPIQTIDSSNRDPTINHDNGQRSHNFCSPLLCSHLRRGTFAKLESKPRLVLQVACSRYQNHLNN